MSSAKNSSTSLAILRLLVRSNTQLSIYSMFKKIGMPLAQLMRGLLELERSGYVLISNDVVQITKQGLAKLQTYSDSRSQTDRRTYLVLICIEN